jgi:hypothetical protein
MGGFFNIAYRTYVIVFFPGQGGEDYPKLHCKFDDILLCTLIVSLSNTVFLFFNALPFIVKMKIIEEFIDNLIVQLTELYGF